MAASNQQAWTVLRPAGKTERRCIMRQVLGYYRSLVVSALYTLPSSSPELDITKELFYPALKHCIETHPILNATVIGADTEAPKFVRPESLDLSKHVEIVDASTLPVGKDEQDELELLKEITIRDHNADFQYSETIPPWKIVVLPLPSTLEKKAKRCYILFSCSHSHADGSSELAFHRSLLAGLRNTPNIKPRPGEEAFNPTCKSSEAAVLPPLESSMKLHITWGYLLGPMLSAYLPKWLSKALGITSSFTPVAPDAWRPTPYSYDAATFRTGMEIIVTDSETLATILRACKYHGTKLTGLLHQIVVRAISAVVSDTEAQRAGSFLAQTPINLRPLMKGWTNDDMGVATTAEYSVFPRVDTSILTSSDAEVQKTDTQAIWKAAKQTSEELSAAAKKTINQPVGLLQYLGHFRMWLTKQIGKRRDTSYELTNIMVFDPEPVGLETPVERKWNLGRTLISQPAHAMGGMLSCNVATRKGGDLVITITWQRGVLGLGPEKEEAETVRKIGLLVENGLKKIADGEKARA